MKKNIFILETHHRYFERRHLAGQFSRYLQSDAHKNSRVVCRSSNNFFSDVFKTYVHNAYAGRVTRHVRMREYGPSIVCLVIFRFHLAGLQVATYCVSWVLSQTHGKLLLWFLMAAGKTRSLFFGVNFHGTREKSRGRCNWLIRRVSSVKSKKKIELWAKEPTADLK